MKDAKGHGSDARGLTTAAQERVALRQRIDAQRFGIRKFGSLNLSTARRGMPEPETPLDRLRAQYPSLSEQRIAKILSGAHSSGIHNATRGKEL